MSEPKDFNTSSEEFKEHSGKLGLSKIDHELYREEEDKVFAVVRVKRIGLPSRGEKWKVMLDNKPAVVVEGTKLTKKEKAFLRTVEGVSFLISQFKAGAHSFNALKTALKQKLNPSP
jgi:hypothetical protein